MAHGDPRYSSPNAFTYPPVTQKAILPYYKRLIAAFGKLADMPVGVAEQRMVNYTRDRRTSARRCWASPRGGDGHSNGWGRMIHDASHEIQRIRHPSERPHGGSHARIEREMAEYVLAQGWVARVSELARKPPKRVSYAERIAHTRALMDKWESKAKRAATAMRKLNRRMRALQRAASKTVTPDTLVN